MRPTAFQSGLASIASTAVPSDLRAGDVVVSYLETTSASGVLCQTSTKVLDQVRGAVRLAACLTRVGSTPLASFSASLTPAGPVAMVTLAFSGVDAQTPVDVQASSASGTSPAVRTSMANEVLVLGEGSTRPRRPRPPLPAAAAAQPQQRCARTGGRGGHGYRRSGHGQRQALDRLTNRQQTAAATIALRPATGPALPTPTPTPTRQRPPQRPRPHPHPHHDTRTDSHPHRGTHDRRPPRRPPPHDHRDTDAPQASNSCTNRCS